MTNNKHNNVISLNPVPKKLVPQSVLINWSESQDFQTGETYSFMDFEEKALRVALQKPTGGYDKTNVTVTFDDGSEHQCRLDLGCKGNDLGFSEHCLAIHEFYLAHHDDPNRPWLREPHHLELIALIEQYELNNHFVRKAKAQQKQAEIAAKREEEAKQALKIAQRKKALEVLQEEEQAFQGSLEIPSWAKAVIVATFSVHDEEQSDPYSDYYASKMTKTIILAWSKHTRNLFPELRKACLNHPDTAFLNNKEESTEHRENYSMGAGTYLTDTDYIRNGWKVKKRIFNADNNKAWDVPLGELTAATQSDAHMNNQPAITVNDNSPANHEANQEEMKEVIQPLNYSNEPLSNHQILEKAAMIISQQFVDGKPYTNPEITKQYLSYQLAAEEKEVFAVMFLNNQNQLVEYKPMFFGTVNAASVYPREIVKEGLRLNAAAVILAHNHPSGNAEPSQADITLTKRIKEALALIDIRVLDHIIIGNQATSLAEKGLI